MKQLFKWIATLPVMCLLMLLCITSCKKHDIKLTTTEDVNIVDYMRKSPEKFSEFLKILDRTSVSPFLNAYGAYTVFAPTNEAIGLYLKEIGKANLGAMDSTELISMVKLHLIRDTLSTTSFTDGKMGLPTMYGQYLTSSVNNSGVTMLNRRSSVTQSNILTGNGYIHVIDHVLVPAKLSLAKMIEQNPAYSIFTQALKATGLYDTLNIVNNEDTTRRWLTLLAEPDTVLNKAGIYDFVGLKNRFNSKDPRNTEDSLYLFTAYHILTGIKYIADIASATSHTTLAPLNVVTSTLSGQTVLLNEATFNGVFEEGIAIERGISDNSATNGVMHSLLGGIYIKKRTPVGVFFDVADQPELRKMVSIFRKAGKSVVLTPGQLKDVTWNQQNITYAVDGATSSNHFYWYDHIDFTLRARSDLNAWIEFTTPLLVAGKYKVWICYRRNGHGKFTQVSFNGEPLPRIIDLTAYLFDRNASDEVNEAQGFKRYSSTAPTSNNTQVGQYAGIITVPTTDRHKIRLTSIKDNGSGNNGTQLDMIQFIPVEMDQQYPRFGNDGSIKKEK